MVDQEQKAIDLMSQADKKLKSAGGFFGSFFGYGINISFLQWLQVRQDGPIINFSSEVAIHTAGCVYSHFGGNILL